MATIVFDFDGVLVRSRFPDGRFLWPENLERELGIPPRIQKELFASDHWHEALIGADFRQRIETVFSKYSLSVTPQAFIDFWLNNDLNWRPEVMAIAQELKTAGHRLVIATNQDRIRGQFIRSQPEIKSLFSQVITSADLGFAKPQIRFFEAAHLALGVPVAAPEVPVFIDDSLRNVESANRVGWKGIHFDPDRGDSFKSLIVLTNHAKNPLPGNAQ